jgi:HTH-type transcriptional regulator, sugar sensing transcriptional regulator
MVQDREEALVQCGLTRNEAKVYLALLELGLTSTKAIIEKAALHRQLVYDALDALVELGLASFVVQANRKHFQAAEPKQMLEFLAQKEDAVEQQKAAFTKILPSLEVLRTKKSEVQEATVFTGNKGIASLLDAMLQQKEEVLTIGASESGAEAFHYHLKFNLPKFHKFREEKGISLRILFSEDMADRAKELDGLRHTATRVLPKEFTSNSSTNIYGDSVSIILWGSHPFGVLIRSREIADAQRKHFQLLWKMSKEP